MTSYFCPEVPTPFCVLTEKEISRTLETILNPVNTSPKIPSFLHDSNDKHLFSLPNEDFRGFKYEDQFCRLVEKYLDINCHDHVLFIQAKGEQDCMSTSLNAFDQSQVRKIEWNKVLEYKFCLLEKVDVFEMDCSKLLLNPCTERSLKLNEEDNLTDLIDFNSLVKHNPTGKYDKIIMKNCAKYLHNNYSHFCKFILKYFKEPIQHENSLLIVQRVSDLNTLPFYSEIKTKWSQADINYVDLIHIMQTEYFSLQFNVEILRFIKACKSKWYKELRDKFPYPMNQNCLLDIKNSVVTGEDDENRRKKCGFMNGIRELNEGIFKYQESNKQIELTDRLLFIGAYCHSSREKQMSLSAQEFKMKSMYSSKRDKQLNKDIQKLSMEITEDLKPFLKLK
jgi:hypothetical protein